jgi:hypothetical protein
MVTQIPDRQNITNGTPEILSPLSNDAESAVVAGEPFQVSFTLRGNVPLIFHRWSVEAVEIKANAGKGSAIKKTDDVESYVWRDEENRICLPGEYVRQSICVAAKSVQDPRSPRRSAIELYKAGIASATELAPMISNGHETTEWDYIDRRRVTVVRAGITRSRPTFTAGWEASFVMQVLTPEYISFENLLDRLTAAGRFVGVGDFRPSYGRFQVVRFVYDMLE